MRNIKTAFITILLAFTVMFTCFSGCGEGIYDLAKLANEGIPIASVLIFDDANFYAVITDGDEYLKVVTLTGYSTAGIQGMTVDSRGCFHIYNGSNIYTYKMDGSYSISTTFNNILGIAAGNGTVYAVVTNAGINYLYSYNSDTGQWADTGADLASIFGAYTPLSNCLTRDNATGQVYCAAYDSTSYQSVMYRVPGFDVTGSISNDNETSFAVCNGEGFVLSGTYGLASSQRGIMATTGTGLSLLFVMDNNNVFYTLGTALLYRYNSGEGVTSKTIALPHSTTSLPIPLDGNRIIVAESASTTCDILLCDYNTGEVIKTIYSYNSPSSSGALWGSVYR
ncbi:MAG TPA: hypothetical protein PLI62_16210 [Spirochaetota bacterium]|nr:hypothetical protein [Spirochaetota bacterium]HQP50346.1 hypothetical protein [Spirochaetota bacterium]